MTPCHRAGVFSHLTIQAELSRKPGISQADISRLENGTGNPTLALLKPIAKAVGATLKIEFIPNNPIAK